VVRRIPRGVFVSVFVLLFVAVFLAFTFRPNRVAGNWILEDDAPEAQRITFRPHETVVLWSQAIPGVGPFSPTRASGSYRVVGGRIVFDGVVEGQELSFELLESEGGSSDDRLIVTHEDGETEYVRAP
jgi:hypothetical protein